MSTKLKTLLEIEGLTLEDFLEQYALESCVPAICMNKNCDAVYEYEPDQDRGYCEECETNSVKSGLILLGII
jgi:hypothetical protein